MNWNTQTRTYEWMEHDNINLANNTGWINTDDIQLNSNKDIKKTNAESI